MSVLNENEILPVNREDLEPIEEEAEAKKPLIEPEEVEEKVEAVEVADEEVFDKKKHRLETVGLKPPVAVSKKTGKPKRVLSEAQKENLKKAREKSIARRKELKEAKLIQDQQKKMAKEIKREEKMAKKEEQEEMIRLKAKLKSEAERQATWDEDRLQGLMEKTIENYIKKKKAMKPEPKVHIPHNLSHPNLPAHHPVQQDPRYYSVPQQQPQQYFNHHYTQPSQPQYQQKKNKASKNPLNSLFGFNPDENNML